jgi:hypothetical protein
MPDDDIEANDSRRDGSLFMLITCIMCGSGSFLTVCDDKMRAKVGDDKPSAAM